MDWVIWATPHKHWRGTSVWIPVNQEVLTNHRSDIKTGGGGLASGVDVLVV